MCQCEIIQSLACLQMCVETTKMELHVHGNLNLFVEKGRILPYHWRTRTTKQRSHVNDSFNNETMHKRK
jgi:hypothetical protein